MSLIPGFKIGLWNGWLLMSWYLIISIIFMANKEIKKRGTISDFKYNKFEKFFLWYIGYIVWIALILYSIFLPLKLGTLWFYIGAPLCLIGLILCTIASINFATASIDKPITKGLYRIMRHPLYLSQDFIYIGIGIACASWLFLLLSIIFIIGQYISVPHEESLCLEKYGESYREYLKRTPRYFLFFKGIKK